MMNSSVISRWFFIFLALVVFASCNRAGGKAEADKAKAVKPAPKAAVTHTVKVESAPKKTTSNNEPSNKTASKKTEVNYNGVTQFHEP